MNIKTLLGCLLWISLSACSRILPSNVVQEIQLIDGKNTRNFLISSEFKAANLTPSLLHFSMQYPTMSARNWQDVPRDDEIHVWITLADRAGKTDFLVSHAADKIDLSKPGQFYRDGAQDGFEIFHGMLDKSTLKPMAVVYVFKDDDGQLVGVEDSGGWSVQYNVNTKIGPDLQIHYNIAKPLGRDFVKINKAVKIFVKSHVKTTGVT